MDDETIIVLVVSAVLAVLVLVTLLSRARRARSRNPLGVMDKPAPPQKEPPSLPHW